MKKFTIYLVLSLFLGAHSGVLAQELRRTSNEPSVCLKDEFVLEKDQNERNERALLNEDFTSGVPPAGWSIIGEGSDNWQSSSTNNAGGIAPEATITWSPQFEGNSKLVSPEVSTTGMTELFLEFKHMVDDYAGGYTLIVETSSDGTNWNTVWSQEIDGSVEAETLTLLVDNMDVGTDNFQFAFTFDGDSYNINNWYIDDVELSEALTYDAGVVAMQAPELGEAGQTLEVVSTVKNFGTETITFDVLFEVLDGASVVYSDTETVTDLGSTDNATVLFDGWTAVLGAYTLKVETLLTGDENADNDELTQNIQIIDNVVPKKPLYEEFTSSTCAPCAIANPIIDDVLEDNPGEYSLIKYQMNWPGAGDPYYIDESGDRSAYYGVAAVPDLYANANQIDPPSSFSQSIFDEYASQITGMDITVNASISADLIINVDANISSYADYPAGMKAHIAVVEKTTYANTGTNGEEEFNNVIMAMLPGSGGTTLDAFSNGDTELISETYDMSQTFMEQANDLAVVVFVQDDTDHSIVQSEMIDVSSTLDSYDVTFNVIDSDGNVIEGAEVAFDINGYQFTDATGQTVFEEVLPGSYDFEVSKSGLMPYDSTIEVVDGDVVLDIVLDIPEYFFYEDFGNGFPLDWTMYFSSGNTNNLYWFDGVMVFWRQNQADEDIMLITPWLNLSQAGTLFFEAGDINSTPSILIGTVSSPEEPETFTELASFELEESMQEYMFNLADAGPFEDSYLVFKYDGPSEGFFYFDNVKISLADDAFAMPENLIAEVDEHHVILNWDAVSAANGYNVYRDDELLEFVTDASFTDYWLEAGIYEYYVTAVYDTGESVASNTEKVNVGDVLEFCEAAGGCSQHISGVYLEDISNDSGCEYYSDFTDQITRLESGETYTLTVNVSNVSSGNDISVWIDYNQDGTFQVDENLTCIIDDGSSSFDVEVNVPSDAPAGPARMRVRVKYWQTNCHSCGYTTWGETEDYTVLIDEYVGINNMDVSSIEVYPNPAKEKVTVSSPNDIRQIEIYNYSGHLISRFVANDAQIEMNVSELNSGMYILRILNDENISSTKLIIE